MTNGNEPIQADPNYGNIGADGLTKREYFAGQALIGMMAYVNKPMDADTIASESVRLADALINALNEKL